MLKRMIVVSLLLLAACAQQTVVPPAKQASYYFQEGEEFFEKGLYNDAIASWEKVRDSYFSPELNSLAELKIAEAHYLAGDYIEAATAYEAFLQNYPDDPRIADVLYQLGLCYTNQMLNFDQDQTPTRYALNAFQTMQNRFPEDRRTEEVSIYIDRCLNQLAANELYIGHFYLKNDEYQAAINRFEGIFKTYPNYFERDKVYLLLGQAYLKNEQKEQAVETFNTLFNEYPQSEYILEAQKFVEENY